MVMVKDLPTSPSPEKNVLLLAGTQGPSKAAAETEWPSAAKVNFTLSPLAAVMVSGVNVCPPLPTRISVVVCASARGRRVKRI